MTRPSAQYLRGRRIDPPGITGHESVADLIDNAFFAYNAGRLREGCLLFTQRMLEPEVTVAMSLTGAMTPAGLGMSSLIPLMEFGFVDWIISTGANLYHDAHFALGLAMHQGTPHADDVELRDKGVTIKHLPPELFPGIDYSAFALDPEGHAIQLYYYMEQIGWDGKPRPAASRRKVDNEHWPESLDALSDTYLGPVFQGPLG